MNRLIITLMLLISASVLAQDFQGTAVYESKTTFKDMKIESKDMNDEMTEKIRKSMEKQYEKTFILNFNKYESVYQEEQKLEAPTLGFSAGMVSSGDSEVTYKNVKTKQQLAEQEFFGKEFLIADSLKVYKWEMQSETKKIGNYTCYKAIVINRISKEDLENYEKEKEKQALSKTAFFIVNEPKERVISVWYSPEIPVSHGPGEFWGLPGLILEASYDDTIILCSKIVLNPKDKFEIKKPKKGKRVTKKEYDSLIEKQLEKMTNQDGVIEIQMN